jgi:tetratricopeptide (TPR) repeat protein
VSRWSNRFVNLGALLLLGACQHMPFGHGPAAARGGPPDENPGDSKAAAGDATANTAPVPPQAAAAYADALRLMRAGRSGDAELSFKQLAMTYPQLAGPEVNLGLLYLQTSHLTEAEAAFKAALERNPGSAVAGNELGIVERRLGKFTEAEATYRRTIAAEPDYAPTYLNLGVLYDLYLGEPQKALDQYQHYIQLSGDNKQVAGWMVELKKRVGAPAPAKKETA